MAYITMKQMLETGVHFGHQTRRWNPKMRPYIFGARNGIHIIDLQQTVKLFQVAHDFIADKVAKGGKVIFVGTKRQAQESVKSEAERSGQFFVTNRWMGGTLTNFQTIKKSIDRLKKIEAMFDDGSISKFPKKEIVLMSREVAKLNNALGGIKDMVDIPAVAFVIDPKREDIAINECRKLGIPIVGVVDTNCDPDVIDLVIPGNDDAIRAIKLFVSAVADACMEGQARFDEQAAVEAKAKAKEAAEAKKAAEAEAKAKAEAEAKAKAEAEAKAKAEAEAKAKAEAEAKAKAEAEAKAETEAEAEAEKPAEEAPKEEAAEAEAADTAETGDEK